MANADGSVIVKVDVDDKEAQKGLKTVEAKIEKINSTLNEKRNQKSGIEKELDSAATAAAATTEKIEELRSKLAETTASTGGGDPFSAMYETQIAELTRQQREQEAGIEKFSEKLKSVTSDIKAQESALNEAQASAAEYQARLAGIVLSPEMQKLEKNLEKAAEDAGNLKAVSASMQQNLEKTEKSAKKVKTETSGMSDAAKKASTYMDKFSRRFKTVVRQALVFSLIAKALGAFKDYVWESIQTNTEAMAAVAKLKGALLTLAQPLLNVLIPAFTVLVNVLTRVINVISQFASLIAGTTVDASARAAKALYEQKKAISGVGSAAKKASKQLASFDELTSISNGASSSTSSAVTPDFTSGINDQLSAIAGLFVGAALLGLGAILTFSGASIPLGLALMVMGGLSIWSAVSENWDEIANALKGQLGKIVGYVSAALVAVGLILLFSGANIPLGLGLLAAGAVGLASVIAANWDSVKTPLINTLKELLLVAAGASLAIGLVLLLTGANIPLGLGLLIAGAAGLAGWIAANWDFIKDKFKSIWNSIKSWWKSNVAPVFTATWWKNLGKKMMNGLIAGVEAGINWVLRGIGDMVNGITGLLNKIPGINIAPVSWGNVKIPRLAQGAVIPPNREFLAVLGDQKHGTNVEAPLETIQQAVAQTFANMSPQFAQAIVSAFVATGMIGNIQAIEDYTRATAAKDFTLGTPNSATGRWVDQSLAAYARVKG